MDASMPLPKSPAPLAVLARAFRANAGIVVAFVRATWKARRHRRDVVRLLQLDDHGLADIGLTRGDVVAVLGGSAFDDPSTRLRILAVERRAGRRAQARERLTEAAVTTPRLGARV